MIYKLTNRYDNKIKAISFNTSKEAMYFLKGYYERICNDLTFPEFLDLWKLEKLITIKSHQRKKGL